MKRRGLDSFAGRARAATKSATMAATVISVLAAFGPACTRSESPPAVGGGPIGSSPPAASPPASTGVIVDRGPPGSAADAGCGAAIALPPPPPGASVQPNLGTTVKAATPPLPLSGGTLTVLTSGRALASDPDRDHLYLVDLVGLKMVKDLALNPHDEPGRIVEGSDGIAFVVLRGGGAVLAVDTASGAVKSRRAVCSTPRGIAFDGTGTTIAGNQGALVHVACADGRLISLPATGDAPVRTLTLDRDLRDVIVGGGGLMVSRFRQAEILSVATDGTVTKRATPPVRQRKGLLGLDTLSAGVAWRLLPQPGAPGSAVVVHQRGVDGQVVAGPGGYADGLGCSSIVESSVSVVQKDLTIPIGATLGLSTLPVDMAMAADGRVAVLSAGNAHSPNLAQVAVFDDIGAMTPAGAQCVAPMGSKVMSPFTTIVTSDQAQPTAVGETIAVAFAPDGTLVGQSREPALLWLMAPNVPSDVTAPRTIALSSDSRADTGHLLFHTNAGGGIACASCHPEGGEDGRVWSFQCIGQRRTQSLRGGISGTEPFHWDGDLSDFPHLVDAVFVARMAGPKLLTDQSTALLKWIDTIPLLPPLAGPSDAVTRGQALFTSATVACGSCHNGAHLTNNMTVAVGLGAPTQVPGLLGVGWRPPFLHTGCAPTLTDRFGACGGGDQHGHTSNLSTAQISDLVAYLESL